MGSLLNEVITLLKSIVPEGVTVYRNVVPEGISKPCVSVTEVSNNTKRVIAGQKYGKQAVWRVTVYVKNDDDMQGLLDILENLDNTTSDDFQRIMSDYVLTEQRQSNQILTRAFYDLTLTP